MNRYPYPRTQTDIRPANQMPITAAAALSFFLNPVVGKNNAKRPDPFQFSNKRASIRVRVPAIVGALSGDAVAGRGRRAVEKPEICTADELHYVDASGGSDWKLALWRYRPSPNAPGRKHPLLLLSGVATTALGFDLSPEFSFASHMSGQGFDTWILEFRGSGLSRLRVGDGVSSVGKGADSSSSTNNVTNGSTTVQDQSLKFIPSGETQLKAASELSASGSDKDFLDKMAQLLNEGLPEATKSMKVASEIRNLFERFSKDGDKLAPKVFDLQERIFTGVEDFQKQVDLFRNSDWDFDDCLEDVHAVMDYIRVICEPSDRKLLAIGHSMGGMLLYALLSRNGWKNKDSGLASIVTLGSSLDYTSSRSSIKYLLPLEEPLVALNFPVVPVGAFLSAVYSFAPLPWYSLAWLRSQITAHESLPPELLRKFVSKNFCTVPVKLLSQLVTAAQGVGGLRDRTRTFYYNVHLRKTNVPVLALAGDQDLICPPDAVYGTVQFFPSHLISYKVFGEPGGPHFSHYDLVGGRLVKEKVYPCILEFLCRHD